MWNLLVFAVLGLLAGASARLFYPGRQAAHVLGTMLVGMIGAVAGGMMSWWNWPWVEGEFPTESLALSLVGAVVLIVVHAAVSYARRVSGRSGDRLA